MGPPVHFIQCKNWRYQVASVQVTMNNKLGSHTALIYAQFSPKFRHSRWRLCT